MFCQVIEVETFLTGTSHQDFGKWFMNNHHKEFHTADKDDDGRISIDELATAVSAWLDQHPERRRRSMHSHSKGCDSVSKADDDDDSFVDSVAEIDEKARDWTWSMGLRVRFAIGSEYLVLDSAKVAEYIESIADKVREVLEALRSRVAF
jgi:hypothetical protein